MTRRRISVAIATRDRPQALARCLESLRAGRVLPAGGGGGRPERAARHPRRRRGRATGPSCRSLGRRRRRRPGRSPERRLRERRDMPLVAVIDDDCVADPGWIEELERAFAADPDLALVGGRVLPLRRVRRPRLRGLLAHEPDAARSSAGPRRPGTWAAATTSRCAASGSSASAAATSGSGPARPARARSTWTSSTGSCAPAGGRSTSPARSSTTSAPPGRAGWSGAGPTATAWARRASCGCARATARAPAARRLGRACGCACSPPPCSSAAWDAIARGGAGARRDGAPGSWLRPARRMRSDAERARRRSRSASSAATRPTGSAPAWTPCAGRTRSCCCDLRERRTARRTSPGRRVRAWSGTRPCRSSRRSATWSPTPRPATGSSRSIPTSASRPGWRPSCAGCRRARTSTPSWCRG